MNDVAGPGGNPPAPDQERVQLAYQVAMNLCDAQDRTVGNLRTRASGIFAAAAFVVTFSSSVHLIGNAAAVEFPLWAAVSLLGVILVQGFVVMLVVWPRPFTFGHSVMEVLDPPSAEAGGPPVNRALVLRLVHTLNENKRQIELLARYYRWATLLLLVEVALVLAAVISQL
ncbi:MULTISPECIES: hypothetical protein [Kitasatospora]|uniref:Integral membrane protein n=1 Tax=Kitasatospora cathayae TaxID=3004092 RepID=A0ABY7PXB6_9ACTN|nr:hypothetical protein [Kitasatospora sp. HUAS 3-15]WBP84995.1 hypothetical protein O1G21_03430 [Kitasatospora sp. HUAS 3-15]